MSRSRYRWLHSLYGRFSKPTDHGSARRLLAEFRSSENWHRQSADDDEVLTTTISSYHKRAVASSASSPPFGRAQFFDSAGAGSVISGLNSSLRAALFSDIYDELDFSRSHFSHMLGAWKYAHPRAKWPDAIYRFLADRPSLERDLQKELDAALPELQKQLDHAHQHHPDRVGMFTAQLAKASYAPKQVYSAILNANSDASWPSAIAFKFDPNNHRCPSDTDRRQIAPTLCALHRHPRNAQVPPSTPDQRPSRRSAPS